MTVTITNSNFEAEVINSDRPVLIDFWAAWCGPCKMIGPVIDEIAAEASYVKVGKVNVDEYPELAQAFGAMSIPLLVVVNNGEVAGQVLGAVPKQEIMDLIAPFKPGA